MQVSRKRKLILPALLSFALIAVIGCSDDNKLMNPFEDYNPVITNDTDNFQFQVTGLDSLSAVVSYTWENSEDIASVAHSSNLTSGVANISIYDSNDSLVYQNGLSASLNDSSSVGVAGNWRIVLDLDDASGEVNFQVQAAQAPAP